MINLTNHQINLIKNIIYGFLDKPGVKIFAFGSRVNNTSQRYSDLDLVLKYKSKIPQKTYYQIMDAFEESDLPFRVDLLDWARISPKFRNNIENECIEL